MASSCRSSMGFGGRSSEAAASSIGGGPGQHPAPGAGFGAAFAAQVDGLHRLRAEHERAIRELREEGARLREENESLLRRAEVGIQRQTSDDNSEFLPMPSSRSESKRAIQDTSYPALNATPCIVANGNGDVASSQAEKMVLNLDELVCDPDGAVHGPPAMISPVAFRKAGAPEDESHSKEPSYASERRSMEMESESRGRRARKRRPSWVSLPRGSKQPNHNTCVCCGNMLSGGARFCAHCGTQAGAEWKRCACGTAVLSDSAFCRTCGAATATPQICRCGSVLLGGDHFCRTCGSACFHSRLSSKCGDLSMLPIWSMARSVVDRYRSMDTSETWKRIHKQVSRRQVSGTTERPRALNPNSALRLTWDLATMLFVLYDAIMLPTAFLPYEEPLALDIVNLGLRIFWTVDFPMCFVCGFTRKDGSTELSLPKVAKHYIRTWMALDIVVILLDWIIWALDVGAQAGSAARSVKVLRATRLARMLRMLRVYRLAVLSNKYMPFLRYVTRSMGTRLALEIVKVMLGMLLVNHIIACLWHFVANFPGSVEGGDVVDNWLTHNDVVSLQVTDTYVLAYHWAMTNFVGQSDINARTTTERIFSVVVLTFAFLVLAVVPPRITTLMTSYQNANAENTTKYLQLTNYLQDHNISQRLAVRLQRAALSGLRLQRMRTPEASIQLLEFVPQELRVELRWEMNSPHILVHPLFSTMDEVAPSVARKLAFDAVSALELAGEDVLFLAWEEPEPPTVFFVCAGSINYMHHGIPTEDGDIDVLKGSWLSEASLWTRWVHRGDAQALQDTSMLILNAASFQEIVLASDIVDAVRRYGERFLERLREMDSDDVTDLTPPFSSSEDVDAAFCEVFCEEDH
mmetsp:Transcript_100626/g.290653  ORF Transcript_100626/g.290653 Transcript_100626/m.290653 type:complete len:862 (-) Transcript_100626:183-2768(-)